MNAEFRIDEHADGTATLFRQMSFKTSGWFWTVTKYRWVECAEYGTWAEAHKAMRSHIDNKAVVSSCYFEDNGTPAVQF